LNKQKLEFDYTDITNFVCKKTPRQIKPNFELFG